MRSSLLIACISVFALVSCKGPMVRPKMPIISSSDELLVPSKSSGEDSGDARSETPVDPPVEQSTDATNFAPVVEMPKEAVPSAIAANADNACPSFARFSQTGNSFLIAFDSLGGSVPAGSVAQIGQGESPALRRSSMTSACRLWARIRNVPAGHMLIAEWGISSTLSYWSTMRAYRAGPIPPATTPAANGDAARIAIDGSSFAVTQDGSYKVLYRTPLSFNKVVSAPLDSQSMVIKKMTYSEIGITIGETETDGCPKAKHDLYVMLNNVSVGLDAYSNGSDTLPADGFIHGIGVMELPTVDFKMVKCI